VTRDITGMKVRRGRPADANAIARIHLETWRTAYEHVFGAERLAALAEQVAARKARWTRLLGGSDSTTFVAEDDGELLGFASVRRGRDDDAAGAGELYAIYVSPGSWRRGAGRELLAAATEQLREDGFGEATLWVLEDNPRARRFYELAGWRPDGSSKRESHLGLEVTEVRYRRTL
jgi:ribosomal protein S18 acetylase RimI-like enzyme